MADSVLDPDAISVVRAVLADLGVPVSSDVPNPRPASFVTVDRFGGPRRDIVTDLPTVTVESWAATKHAAFTLAARVRQTLHAARGTVVADTRIYSVGEAAGPGSLPDPLSNHARVTQTFTVALRSA